MIALILTGGRSRRMGRDKLLIERPDGMRQIDWLAKLVREAGLKAMLSRRDDSPAPVDLPTVIDRRAEGGPLAALEAFHELHPGQPVLLLGGDLFLMDALALSDLLAGRDESRAATCFANRIDARPEPLCTIYEARAVAQASEWLSRGEYTARHFLAQLDPKVIPLRSPAALDNVNTPRDLHEALQKLRGGIARKQVAVVHPRFAAEVETLACTLGGLLEELSFRQRWDESAAEHAPFRNGDPADWNTLLQDGDRIVFGPPTAPEAASWPRRISPG